MLVERILGTSNELSATSLRATSKAREIITSSTKLDDLAEECGQW
ncbi:MAG: hypothetical protein ACP5NO_05810 [Thermoplasmata archaeon]